MNLNSDYNQISSLITTGNYKHFGPAKNLQYLNSVNGNTIFIIIDKSDNVYVGEVFYNPDNKTISYPLLSIEHRVSSSFISLPIDQLHEIAIIMNKKDIFNLCLTDKYLNLNICNNDDFWRKKYLHTFQTSLPDIKIPVLNWKSFYLDMTTERYAELYYLTRDKDVSEIRSKLKKGDIIRNVSDENRENSIFDGDNIVVLTIDRFSGMTENMSKVFDSIRILEEPDYFPPQYWHNIEVTKNNFNIDPILNKKGRPKRRNKGIENIYYSFKINFNHVLYKEELIRNVSYDDNLFPGNYIMYTSFIDQRGTRHYIFFDYSAGYDKDILNDKLGKMEEGAIKEQFIKLLSKNYSGGLNFGCYGGSLSDIIVMNDFNFILALLPHYLNKVYPIW